MLETFVAKNMEWFAACGLRYESMYKDASTGKSIRKLISRLLAIPCFKVRDLCFQLGYLLLHRKLTRLGRQCALLGGEDYSLNFRDLILRGFVPSDALKTLENIKAVQNSFESRRCLYDLIHVKHGIRGS